MSNKEIKTFIFDCFGVICDPIISNWYKEKSAKLNFADSEFHNVLKKFDLGILSENELADYFVKYQGINLTRQEILDEIDGYFKIDQNLLDIIKKLKENGYKTALLTNANNSFFERKIYKEYPEFKELFNEIVISSLVNMLKPDSPIYLYALKKMDSKAGNSLFIDDNKENVDAAISLGMKGFLYTDSSSFAEYIKNMGVDV